MIRTPRWDSLRLAAMVALLLAGNAPAQAAEAPSKPTDTQQAEASLQSIGVEIGEFFIRDVRGSEGVKTRISFTLFAEVTTDHERTFRNVVGRYESRIRDQVIIAIRLSQTGHFQEPTLTRLKRRILMRLRRVVPDLQVESLMFRDFLYFTD